MRDSISDESPLVVKSALDELQHLRPEETESLKKVSPSLTRALVALIRHDDEIIQKLAIHIVAKLGEDAGDITPELVRVLSSPNQEISAAAVRALGAIGARAAEHAMYPLIAQLQSRYSGDAMRAIMKIDVE